MWPEAAIPQLQDCFHFTKWEVFRGQGTPTQESLDEYTTSVMDYVKFCVDSVSTWNKICVSKSKAMNDT